MAKTKSQTAGSRFGPVSRINTAPVAVGNSVRGTKPRVIQSKNGARIIGRDFAFELSPTVAAITGWEVIGGMPLTPCALPSSILRNYCTMYANFRINKITAHYITSSPTSQAGDVLFYYEQKRFNPFPDYSNSSFLPFVLSDPNTVIGPQWTNHSAVVDPVKDWKSTSYGLSLDLDEESAGSLYLFSKTNAANSPGYIILDYDISFRNLALNPRIGVLPVARAQNTEVCFTITGSTATQGTAASFAITTGKTVSGATSVAPTGSSIGDVYKCVIQLTSSTASGVNAAWTTVTAADLLQNKDDTAITLDDGHTFYVTRTGSDTWKFYSTVDNARNDSFALEWGRAMTGCVANMCATISLVTNMDDFQQSSYPG